jgi:hypothetical protein
LPGEEIVDLEHAVFRRPEALDLWPSTRFATKLSDVNRLLQRRPGRIDAASTPREAQGQWRAAALLTSRPISRIELALAAGCLAALGAAVYGAHVAHGGFWLDDWSNAAAYKFAPHPRYFNTVRNLEDYLGGRPVLALGVPIPYALLGMHSSLHLGLALALGILTSWSFFLLLRTLSMPRLHAFIVSALALVFPWADSLRLWPTAGLNDLAVIFYLLGATLALRGLEMRGARSAAVHAAAVALYVLSVLTYEAASIAALLTGSLYLARASTRRALRRWAIEALPLVGALSYSAVATSQTRGVGALHDRLADVRTHVRQSVSLLASVLFPVDAGRAVKGIVLALVLAIAFLALRRRRDAQWDAYRPWVAAGIASVVALAATYVVFLGKGLYPLSPGRDNRVNVFAALPWTLLAYSILMVAAMLVCSRINQPARAPLVAAAAAVLIGAGYVVMVERDVGRWDRAADLQRPVLSALRALPRVPRGTTIFTFRYPGQVAPEIYIFAKVYDLDGAAKIVLDDGSVKAYPIIEPTRISCGEKKVIPHGVHFGPNTSTPYGRALFLDIPTARPVWIRDRSSCRRAIRRLVPGRAQAG